MRFEGAGVYYAATAMEAQLCVNDEIIIVGGGNSAGQAAVFLAQTAKRVTVLVRGAGLADTMSRYLIRRIEDHPAIVLRTQAEIVALEGDLSVERVRVRDNQTGNVETLDISHVFMMTGAVPNTRWLEGCVVLDDKGFIKTGPSSRRRSRWRRLAFATSHRLCSKRAGLAYLRWGMFAAGTSSAWLPRSARARSRSPLPIKYCINRRGRCRTSVCAHCCGHDDQTAKRHECEECMKIGGRWVHLRTCQACGVTLAATTRRTGMRRNTRARRATRSLRPRSPVSDGSIATRMMRLSVLKRTRADGPTAQLRLNALLRSVTQWYRFVGSLYALEVLT